MVLVGYMPIPVLAGLDDKQKATQRLQIFHACMAKLVEPLVQAGKDGILLRRADGTVCHAFPVLAAFMGNYPEQCRVVGCMQNSCATCVVKPDKRGENLKNVVFRDKERTLKAMREQLEKPGSTHVYVDENLRPCYPPFWHNLPHTDIFRCITPDLLHQIHKGVFLSHAFKWALTLAEQRSDKEEVDNHFKCIPDHPLIRRRFTNGVSEIKQWTGVEAKAVAKSFIGVLAGLLPPRAMRAIRALIDFLYYATYHSHTDATLKSMEDALDEFHANKSIFIDEGIRTHFNFAKLHMLVHYVYMIKLLGTTDGYNTEATERRHIDLAKNLYRATNKKDYIRQMIEGLQRKEQMLHFDSYIQWRAKEDVEFAKYIVSDGSDTTDDLEAKDDVVAATTEKIERARRTKYGIPEFRVSARFSLPKNSSWTFVTPNQLAHARGADQFVECLRKYISETYPSTKFLPTSDDYFHVFKRMGITMQPLNGFEETERKDTIRATPSNGEKNSKDRFDTVLVHDNDKAQMLGVEGEL